MCAYNFGGSDVSLGFGDNAGTTFGGQKRPNFGVI